MSAQRSALSVVASCCHDIVCIDDFRYIRDSLDLLIARLTQQVVRLTLVYKGHWAKKNFNLYICKMYVLYEHMSFVADMMSL